MPERVYLDNAATTPLDPRVEEVMRPWLGARVGNPSSLHSFGREAREAVEDARQKVAGLLHAAPEEIVFTGSGTEADNLALAGSLRTGERRLGHVVTSAIEHPAVLETCRHLERHGIAASYLPVDAEGRVDPATLESALMPSTRLVSVMAANNVVGTLQPITELGRIAHAHGALFHTDAVQAAGKLPLDLRAEPIDLLSLSAHKLNGPQGIGALYVRRGVTLEPFVRGGGQERGLRSGTESVAAIVGFGQAAEIAAAQLTHENARLARMSDRILETLEASVPNVYLVGDRHTRLPGHLCLGFRGQEGEAIRLLLALDEEGIGVSSGSACSAGHSGEPSYVLLAMGFDPIRARGSLRVTLGRFTTEAEIDRFLDVLPPAAASLRPLTSHVATSA